MKHILLAAGFILIFVTTFAFADEAIVKVGENNVEVKTIYYKDTKGTKPVTIKSKSYGQTGITEELKTSQAELSTANAINCLTYKADQIAIAQDKINKLNLIQIEMDK